MLLNRLTQRAKLTLLAISKESKSEFCEIDIVLGAISESMGVGNNLLKKFKNSKINKKEGININRLVEEAFYQSIKFNHAYVGTEHLLLAVFQIIGSPDVERIRNEIVRLGTFPHGVGFPDFIRKTPILDAFGDNLTEIFAKSNYPSPVSRTEVDDVISVLLQKTSPNPLIVGDSGVGKHSIVDLLVYKISRYQIPVSLTSHNVIEFDFLAFIASVSSKEGLEFGLSALVEELSYVEKPILYIKNLQNIFVSTNAGLTVPFAFSMFKSDLEGSGIKMIGTISGSLYEKIISENEHILRGFSVVDVEEPSEETALRIMKREAKILSAFHNISISTEAISYAFKKAKSEVKDAKFPQKGVDLLDQACSRAILINGGAPKKLKNLVESRKSLDKDIEACLERGNYELAVKLRKNLSRLEKGIKTQTVLITHVPLILANKDIDSALLKWGVDKPSFEDNFEGLGDMADRIKQRIIGQAGAVDTVVKSLIRSKLGLTSRKRPMGNFLFIGPTGVGKTELAKVLADCAFGKNNLIRLDMSDFGEKHTVARLIGAPPGYVGYGEGGDLTSRIEATPESVVLFDEIEKAHPDVLNILLQIMEEGELADAKGNIFDFSSAVIILTSNLGTEIIQKRIIGYDDSSESENTVEKRLRENLKKILKPELLNRFDEVVVFKKLGNREQNHVLNLMLNDVNKTIKKQKIHLSVDLAVKKHLLKVGYSEEYGARALRRAVETELLDRIATLLLKEKKRPLKLNANVDEKTSELTISVS